LVNAAAVVVSAACPSRTTSVARCAAPWNTAPAAVIAAGLPSVTVLASAAGSRPASATKAGIE
jgi:hypothetical protein